MDARATRPARAVAAVAVVALVAAGWTAAVVVVGAGGAAARRPNVLLVVADDLGSADVGAFGGRVIHTPNIDRLVRNGMVLRNFYTWSVCAPSRGAMLTGRYPFRQGIHRFGGHLFEDEREVTLASRLKEAGYATALVGKWHLGMTVPPTERGFDSFYGVMGSHINYFSHLRYGELDWWRDTELIKEPGYATDLLADEAVRLLRSYHDDRPDQPWLMYLSFNAPHYPWGAPAEYEALYSFVQSLPFGRYAGAVTAMDAALGRVMAELARQGALEDTLVILTSDNGGELPCSANWPLSGGKWTAFEGGVRWPAVLSWPGTIPPGTSRDDLIHIMDFFPTILDLAGVDPHRQELPIDGRSFAPIIRNHAFRGSVGHDTLVTDLGPELAAVRSGDTKVLLSACDAPFDADRSLSQFPDKSVMVFNVTANIAETRNLLAASKDPERWQKAIEPLLDTLHRYEQQAKPANEFNRFCEQHKTRFAMLKSPQQYCANRKSYPWCKTREYRRFFRSTVWRKPIGA